MKHWILYFASLVSFVGSSLYMFLGLEPEASQGYVQKIFFFHVPAAFAMYLALIVGAIISGLFLYERKKLYDQIARASLYTATFFAIIVIISGPIWAKPIWGVYWTWDPRLTTTFVVFVLLLGYCFVRILFQDREGHSDRGAIIGAIISILALLDVPLVHFSVTLWRGVHPMVIKNQGGLPENYRTALEMMTLSTFLLCGLIFVLFFKLIRLSDQARVSFNQQLDFRAGEENA